ncbi:MAG: hypothetical protein NTX52_14255 [Planctomycetota bacterium]|nr:hypothetical protein [Planctomycetota bacterium]
MSNKQDFERQICEIQQSLAEQDMCLQTCMNENENIRRRVASLISRPVPEDVTVTSITLKQIAIANGRLLSPEKMLNINEDDYDVILDCVNRTLLARKDPDKSTKLEKCQCKDIGRDRLKLLRYMLEHPTVPICEETMPYVYGDIASMSPNALAHSILAVRKCLWQAPYIVTDTDWGESVSQTGSVYLLNLKYKYLVIRYKI